MTQLFPSPFKLEQFDFKASDTDAQMKNKVFLTYHDHFQKYPTQGLTAYDMADAAMREFVRVYLPLLRGALQGNLIHAMRAFEDEWDKFSDPVTHNFALNHQRKTEGFALAQKLAAEMTTPRTIAVPNPRYVPPTRPAPPLLRTVASYDQRKPPQQWVWRWGPIQNNIQHPQVQPVLPQPPAVTHYVDRNGQIQSVSRRPVAQSVFAQAPRWAAWNQARLVRTTYF